MAELFGVAAGIIQIAGAGAKLSMALYNFTSSAVRADQEIRDIAGDVELTSNALSSVGEVFKTEDARSIVSKKAIQDANGIIKRCEEVFGEITEMVDKRRKVGDDGKKKLGLLGKMTWPMKEQRVELNRRRLESLKNSLVLFLHVLQLAQGQSRGNLERTAIEEERKTIRELHQRQQESLKSLLALESKFTNIALDDDETLRGSTESLPPPPPQAMLMAHVTSLPPIETRSTPKRENTITIDLSSTNDSDTSDSDVTVTDDEDTHLSIEELTKCAKHVQTLLKRITLLQQTFESTKKAKPHRKKHVHKIYRRFCRKFDSSIGVDRVIQRVDSSKNDVPSEPMIELEQFGRIPSNSPISKAGPMFFIHVSDPPVLESDMYPESLVLEEKNVPSAGRDARMHTHNSQAVSITAEQWFGDRDDEDDTVEPGVARKEDEVDKQGGNEDDVKAPSSSKETSEKDHLLHRLRSKTVGRTSKRLVPGHRMQSRDVRVPKPVEMQDLSHLPIPSQSLPRLGGMSRGRDFTLSMGPPPPPEGASEFPPPAIIPMPVPGSGISKNNSSANSTIQDESLPQEEPGLTKIKNPLASQGPFNARFKNLVGSKRRGKQYVSYQKPAGSTMPLPDQQGFSSLQQMVPPTAIRPEINVQTSITGQSEAQSGQQLQPQQPQQPEPQVQSSMSQNQVGMQSPMNPQMSTGLEDPPQTLGDPQLQRMLLEQENKMRSLMARQDMVDQSVPTPQENTFFTDYLAKLKELEEQRKLRLWPTPQDNVALMDYQARPKELEEQNKHAALMDYQARLKELEEQNKRRLWPTPQDNVALMDYQARLKELKEQNKHAALMDYQEQLKKLEEQNKSRLWGARQDQDATGGAAQESPTNPQTLPPAPSPQDPRYTPTSGFAQLIKRGSTQEAEIDDHMHFETQSQAPLKRAGKKKAFRSAIVSQEAQVSEDDEAQIMELEAELEQDLAGSESSLSPPSPQNNRANPYPAAFRPTAAEQRDYQSQLILLEQQNKKRLEMARQEQEESSRKAKQKDHDDYQSMLILLEEQNKKRLEMARQEREEASKRNQTAAETSSPPILEGTMPASVNSERSWEPGDRLTSGTKIKSAMIEDDEEDEDEDEDDEGLVIEYPDKPRKSFEHDRAQPKLILSDEQNEGRLEQARQEQEESFHIDPWAAVTSPPSRIGEAAPATMHFKPSDLQTVAIKDEDEDEISEMLTRELLEQEHADSNLILSDEEKQKKLEMATQEQQELSVGKQIAAGPNSPPKSGEITDVDVLPERSQEPRRLRYPANKVKAAEIIEDSDADSIMLDSEDKDKDEDGLIIDFGDMPSEHGHHPQFSFETAQNIQLESLSVHSFSRDHMSDSNKPAIVFDPAQELHSRTNDPNESSSDGNTGTRAAHPPPSLGPSMYDQFDNDDEIPMYEGEGVLEFSQGSVDARPTLPRLVVRKGTRHLLSDDRTSDSGSNFDSSASIPLPLDDAEAAMTIPSSFQTADTSANPRVNPQPFSDLKPGTVAMGTKRSREEDDGALRKEEGLSGDPPLLIHDAGSPHIRTSRDASAMTKAPHSFPSFEEVYYYHEMPNNPGVAGPSAFGPENFQNEMSGAKARRGPPGLTLLTRSTRRSHSWDFDSGSDLDWSEGIVLPSNNDEVAMTISPTSQTATTSANPSVDPQPHSYNPRPQPFSDLKGGNVAMGAKRSRDDDEDRGGDASYSLYASIEADPDEEKRSREKYAREKKRWSRGPPLSARRMLVADGRPASLQDWKRRKTGDEEMDVENEMGRRFVGYDVRRKSEEEEDIVDVLLSQWTVLKA